MKTFLHFTLKNRILLTLFLSFLFSIVSSDAQISGFVFRDYNANGKKDNTSSFNENGVKGIIVTAFKSDGAIIASFKTATTGLYAIPVSGTAYNNILGSNTGFVVAGTGVRVEFSGLEAGDYPAVIGADNKGNVQFAKAPASNINFAVSYPADYAQPDPRLVTSVYRKGDAPATEQVLISVDYNASGGNKNYPNISTEGVQSQLGSTYGLAFHRSSNTLFAGSYQKRNTSYGSANSTGAIYKIPNPADNSTSGVSLFVDLNVLYGSNIAGANPHPNGVGTDFKRDDASYGKVGKIAFGDMAVSEDELNLWAINLNDRRLYKIPLGTDPYNPVPPTSTSQISSYPVFNICDCNNNGSLDLQSDIDARPFALKVYHGKVYIGLICTAESTPTVFSNLTARVFAFDPVTATTVEVLNFPLNYNRGNGNTSAVPFPNGVPAGSGYANANAANWRPWNDVYTTAATFKWSWYDVAWKEGGYSQAIFSAIDFDDNGNMIIGLRDRFGDMIGDGVYEPGGTIIMEGDGNGDLIRAKLNAVGTGWNFVTSEATNGTEFFAGDSFGSLHEETSMGGLTVYHGRDNIISTTMDPENNLSGGFDWTKPSNGALDRSYEIVRRPGANAFTSTMFAKSNALGEVELLADAAPVEIGNKVWFDLNSDGIQGADENGIANIALELFADFNNDGIPDGPAIATTITDASGEWYFNKANITDGDPGIAGNQAGLKFGAGYIIRIGKSDWDFTNGNGIGDLLGVKLTTTNAATGSGAPGLSDNDAKLTTGSTIVPQITIKAGMSGQSNHDLDFGFKNFSILPLNTLSFTGKNNSNGNELSWLTAKEISIDRFEIEVSQDATVFSALATIASAGNTNSLSNEYSFLHKNAFAGLNYYRLKIFDKNGKFEYSSVIAIKNEKDNNITVLTYPNPVTTELRIGIPVSWVNKKVTAELVNTNGQLIKKIQNTQSSNTQIIKMNDVASGFYIVRITCDGVTGQQKIIKQ